MQPPIVLVHYPVSCRAPLQGINRHICASRISLVGLLQPLELNLRGPNTGWGSECRLFTRKTGIYLPAFAPLLDDLSQRQKPWDGIGARATKSPPIHLSGRSTTSVSLNHSSILKAVACCQRTNGINLLSVSSCRGVLHDTLCRQVVTWASLIFVVNNHARAVEFQPVNKHCQNHVE